MRRSQSNIAVYLRDRESGHVDRVLHCPQRFVPLLSVIDKELLDGHVMLGFSRCGQFLISYESCVSEEGEHEYSLHWWRFNLFQPMRHVCGHPLFRKMFERDVHITVAQPPGNKYTIVLGCMRSVKSEDRRTCHIAILPGPDVMNPTIQLKFDLLPPFSKFLPYLALQIPDWILLNTGDKLVAVTYLTTTRYKSVLYQCFSRVPDSGGLESVDSSPSHLLPVEVFQEDVQLSPCCSVHTLPLCHSDTNRAGHGEVVVGQSAVDVEVWANQVLCSELEAMGHSYHCLLDYDLQIVEVSGDRCEAVFVMATLLEIRNDSGSRDSYSVDVVGVWDVLRGLAHARQVSPPNLMHGHTHPPVSVEAEATRMRSRWYIPPDPYTAVMAFSNHSVHAGKSLQFLHHPFLPISLVR